MPNKINLMLHVAFFPVKDLLFAHNSELVEVAWNVHHNEHDSPKSSFKLRSKLYPSLLTLCRPSTLDQIDLILEKFHPYLFRKYFDAEETITLGDMELQLYKYYFSLIEHFARALLSHRDGEMVFKYWKQEMHASDMQLADVWEAFTGFDKVHMFSTLSRLLPLDLLVVKYHAVNHLLEPLQLDGLYQHINLADAPLHDILRQGVAENHMHASAASTFTLLWQACMNFNGMFKDNIIGEYIKQFKTSFTCTSMQVGEYLLTAQLIRRVLCYYFASRTPMAVSKWTASFEAKPFGKLNELLFGDRQFASIEELKDGLAALNKMFKTNVEDEETDWVFDVFGEYKQIKTYGEFVFMQQVVKYIESNDRKNRNSGVKEVLSLFFRYIRIKNEFYQQVNQSKAINGLDYFRTYFNRATGAFDSKSDRFYLDMFRNLFQNQYLQKVEFRMSVEQREAKNRLTILRILKAYRSILSEDYNVDQDRQASFPRIGIVYHLIKMKDDLNKDWRQYANREEQISKLHYGKIQRQYLNQIKMILNLRNRIPYLSHFIVGLDAASLENNTPVQVFAPVYSAARNSDDDKMVKIDRDGNKVRHQSMFFTFHAGEDFRHLNSGLRRIDEVIDYCKFHSGDRIGHGIALGISVEAWVKENGKIIIPQGEYLDNLLWTWGVYTKISDINYKTHSYLQHKIHEVVKNILADEFDYGISIEMLYDTYKKRFKEIPESLNIGASFADTGNGAEQTKWSPDRLMRMYHERVYLERLAAPIYVNATDIEKEITMDMQRYVRRKVAMNGIVVEVNPSSNQTIGEMNSLFDNQFFQINKPHDKELDNIMISINTDDPIVFNTNISNEIAYLYYGMLYRGIGKSAAIHWIESVRKSGMDTSFIRDKISNYDYIEQLDNLIAALQDPMYCEEC